MSRRQQTLKELEKKLATLTATVKQLKAGLKAANKPKISDQEASNNSQSVSNNSGGTASTHTNATNDPLDDINMGPSFIPLLLTSEQFIWANKVFISCIFILRMQFI